MSFKGFAIMETETFQNTPASSREAERIYVVADNPDPLYRINFQMDLYSATSETSSNLMGTIYCTVFRHGGSTAIGNIKGENGNLSTKSFEIADFMSDFFKEADETDHTNAVWVPASGYFKVSSTNRPIYNWLLVSGTSNVPKIKGICNIGWYEFQLGANAWQGGDAHIHCYAWFSRVT